MTKEDGSRHTKWIKAIYPRLQMMKSMLRPSGVIAICIDDNELFHLGMMMDEIFGEKNRLGIINWQKSAAPRPDNNHVSSSTEYVLVYSRDKDLAVTASLARTGADNRRYGHWDKDPNGLWREGNLTAKTYSAGADYAIQSPFTGEVHYPAGNGSWRHPKRNIKTWLAMWGAEYEERSIRDGRSEKALMIVGAEPNILPDGVRRKALKRLAEPHWPFVWFGHDGGGRPRVKTYLERIKRGKVPVSYWASEEFAEVTETGSSSWDYEESGRSSDGVSELTAIVGDGHGFTTVKPLKLMEKIIEIWCPPGGLVLDPYAGSGTTGHAVLNTNAQTGADRRFILIEQGEPTNGDKYARSLTWKRLRNAITGDRPGNGKTDALGGGFEYRLLTKTIDARALMAMKRDELVDVVLTSHWETHKRNAPGVQRLEGDYQYLIGQDAEGEAYFLIWDNDGPVGALDLDSYKIVATEAKKAGLKPPFHVYARYEDFQSPNVRFWKIPDRILAHLGLDENESYNDVEGSA